MYAPILNGVAVCRAFSVELRSTDARVEDAEVLPIGLVFLHELDVLGGGHVGVQRRTVPKDHVQRHVVVAVARWGGSLRR